MQDKQVPTGVLGTAYVKDRQSGALKYRLRRRAQEVIDSVNKYGKSSGDLLDLGPAEGKSLSIVQDAFPQMRCVGLEYSQDLIDACTDSRLKIIQGDAMEPPFEDESFDTVSATAIIEHVASPKGMLLEVFRILRPGGIVIITTPDPFFEHIATAIGHLKDEDHQETMTLKKLRKYFKETGFEPLVLEKFMCSPWGFPGEHTIENIMKKIGLGFLLLNQLAVAKKP